MSGASKQGEVQVATVTFDVAPSVVDVGSDATINGVVVATFDGDVLSYKPSLVGTVVMADGSVLKGIRQMAEDGSTLSTDTLAEIERPLLMLHAEDGGSITVVHDSGDVTEPTERITTAYGIDTTIGPDLFQVFCLVSNGNRRWRSPAWSAFFVTSPRWVTRPTTTNQAINDLAERMPAGYSGVTAGAGTFTVVFANAYTNTPRVVASAVGAGSTVFVVVTARSNTGFTVTAYTRNPLALLPDAATNGVTVDVIVVSND